MILCRFSARRAWPHAGQCKVDLDNQTVLITVRTCKRVLLAVLLIILRTCCCICISLSEDQVLRAPLRSNVSGSCVHGCSAGGGFNYGGRLYSKYSYCAQSIAFVVVPGFLGPEDRVNTLSILQTPANAWLTELRTRRLVAHRSFARSSWGGPTG